MKLLIVLGLIVLGLVVAVWAAVAYTLRLRWLGTTLLSFSVLLLMLAWLSA